MNLGSKPPPSARVTQLCFPLASPESLGSGTHGGAGLRLTGRAEGREGGGLGPWGLLMLRSGPPVLFGAWWPEVGDTGRMGVQGSNAGSRD